MVELVFDKSSEILRMNTSGTININDIVAVYNAILKNDTYPKELNILIDTRKSKFEIDLNEVVNITDVIKKVLNKYSIINEAILIEKPYETVIVTLVRDHMNFENYNLKIFHTENAALSWLIN